MRSDVRRGGEAEFGTPAELIGNRARAAMLRALLGGRALPLTMLAAEAGVAVSTASEHLERLVAGGLVRTRREGRHRYFVLGSPDVGAALEALARLSPPVPVRSLREGTRAFALRRARSCYDHLAGRLGVAVMVALLERGSVVGGDGVHRGGGDRISAFGHEVDYRLTPDGRASLDELGVVVPAGRRREVGYCVDWTEQRHHLAGAVGAGLLTRFLDLGWLARGPGASRALTVTDAGRRGFAGRLGVDVDELAAA